MREALRDNEITTLAVNSPGGNVYSGLLLSGVIFDKGINIYIPRGAECASACSFIFFAGKERVIDGRLGVHQFSTPSNYRTDINSAEERTQNLVAEVTGYSAAPFHLVHRYPCKCSGQLQRFGYRIQRLYRARIRSPQWHTQKHGTPKAAAP